MVTPVLYIFTGAPGCGKSECLNWLSKHSFDIIQKQTTRPPRLTDSIEIVSTCNISDDCDIRYTQYGIEYGFSSLRIWDSFAEGRSVAVIINDIRTIRIVKRKFGSLARSIYVHRNLTKLEIDELTRARHKCVTSEIKEDADRRSKKIETIHQKYIENTSLFDFTLLNLSGLSDLYLQLENIIQAGSYENRRVRSTVKIFVIVGASYSGKDELVSAMWQMDNLKVSLYRKITTRPKRDGDNKELRHRKRIDKSFNLRYQKNGFSYAISSREIWKSLSNGTMNLLVLSDSDCIERLLDEFGRVCTVIYLHANLDLSQMRNLMEVSNIPESEIIDRLQDVYDLYKLYKEKTFMFDHVLINTAEKEDLYDQAFNILDYYSEHQ